LTAAIIGHSLEICRAHNDVRQLCNAHFLHSPKLAQRLLYNLEIF
jgi:hypothetical protein